MLDMPALGYSSEGLGLFLRLYEEAGREAGAAGTGVDGTLRSTRLREARAALMPAAPSPPDAFGEPASPPSRGAAKADEVGVSSMPSVSEGLAGPALAGLGAA